MARETFRRYLQPQVESDLGRKMVFISGPRQVGKTWLGRAVIDDARAYFRDIDGREVDFVLTETGKLIGFVECKPGDAPVSAGLTYLHARFPAVPAWQVSAAGIRDYLSAEGIRVCPAHELLRQLVYAGPAKIAASERRLQPLAARKQQAWRSCLQVRCNDQVHA